MNTAINKFNDISVILIYCILKYYLSVSQYTFVISVKLKTELIKITLYLHSFTFLLCKEVFKNQLLIGIIYIDLQLI